MKKIIIFMLLSPISCSQNYEKYQNISIFKYLKSETRHSITIGSLIVANHVHSKINFKQYIDTLDKMAEKVKSYVGDSKNPHDRVEAMNKVIFQDYGYKYDHDKIRNKSNYYLPTVMMRLKGNCFGLPLLYLCLAERLEYPIYPVHAPWHLFCRYVDGETKINIEVTSGGKQISDIEYLDNFLITQKAYKNSSYLKTVFNKKNFIAYISTNIAIHYMYKQPDMTYQFLRCGVDLNPDDIGLNTFAGFFFKERSKMQKIDHHILYSINKSDEYYSKAEYLGANYLDPIKYNIAYEKHKKTRPKITTKEEAIQYYNKLKRKYHDYFN